MTYLCFCCEYFKVNSVKWVLISSSGGSRCALSKFHRLCCVVQMVGCSWLSKQNKIARNACFEVFARVLETLLKHEKEQLRVLNTFKVFSRHTGVGMNPFYALYIFRTVLDRAMQTSHFWSKKTRIACDTLLQSIVAKVLPKNFRHRGTTFPTKIIEKICTDNSNKISHRLSHHKDITVKIYVNVNKCKQNSASHSSGRVVQHVRN